MPNTYNTDLERETLFKELLDGNRVTLICGPHQYIGDGPPSQLKCKDCWYIYFYLMYAKTPPHKRAESLDQWEKAIRDNCQQEDEGTFDFQPYDHPRVIIEEE